MSLKEGQFQLGSVVFGKNSMIKIIGVEQIGYEMTPGDYSVPQSDEIRFRRDYVKPGVVQFQLAVLDNYMLEGMSAFGGGGNVNLGVVGAELLEQFKAEWRADDIRKNWGWVKPLTYRAEGYNRILYGRPRNLSASRLKSKNGWYDITCSYQLADSLSYEEQFSSIAVEDTTAAGTNPVNLVRGIGKAPAWLRAYVTGPLNSPVIDLGPHKITLDYNIPAGQIVEINSFPWERRCITSSGLNIGAKLIADSPYLEDLRIPPGGTWACGLHGTGATAPTRMVVQWQEAFHAV